MVLAEKLEGKYLLRRQYFEASKALLRSLLSPLSYNTHGIYLKIIQHGFQGISVRDPELTQQKGLQASKLLYSR